MIISTHARCVTHSCDSLPPLALLSFARAFPGLDESVCEKLDRLRISSVSSPKLLPKMRGFSTLAGAAASSASFGRTSPSILIRRTKGSPGPSLSIDPHLTSTLGAAAADYERVPLAPRSDGSSANGSAGSWVGAGSVRSSTDSLEGISELVAMGGLPYFTESSLAN